MVLRMKLIGWMVLFLMIEVVAAIKIFAFNITMQWDIPVGATTNDIFTTNVTRFADIKEVHFYRGTSLTNFVLYSVVPYTVNSNTFVGLPNEVSWMFFRYANATGEGAPSSTNQIFPPGNPPKGSDKFSKQ